MSTKDYKMIAAGFAHAEAIYADSPAGMSALKDAARKIADGLQADNPRFDRPLFIEACFPLARICEGQIRERLWGRDEHGNNRAGTWGEA